MKYSGIGGQAVIEGVMMKNKDNYAVAVRKPDGTIEIKKDKCKSTESRPKFLSFPFIRGVVNFIDSMVLGMSTLSFSSSFYDDEEDEKAKDKKPKTAEQKKKSEDAFNVISIILAILMAVGIFMVAPYLVSHFLIAMVIKSQTLLTLFEGLLRLLFFIIYVVLISLMKDIRRVYMYHGAEHKCINCLEHGMELTVENVRKSSKEHKRCGTSFLLIIMCLSIVIMMVVRFDSRLINFVVRLALIPVIAGISYEFLRLAGKYDNPFMNFLSKPGLLLQGLTTKEPDDDMIEVGIASVEAIFDWKQYLKENFGVESDKMAGDAVADIHEGAKADSQGGVEDDIQADS